MVYYMIHLITAVGLTAGGSSTVHIYTHTHTHTHTHMHTNTQNDTMKTECTEQDVHNNKKNT